MRTDHTLFSQQAAILPIQKWIATSDQHPQPSVLHRHLDIQRSLAQEKYPAVPSAVLEISVL
jgi:hypothetical protein